MSVIKRIALTVSIAVFSLGVIMGLIGQVMCVRDNQNYQVTQPELFAPDEIANVLYDEDLRQLYVCYNDASYVNVYSADGDFLWAVSTPYLRNAYFELSSDQLTVYNSDLAYVYNSANGSFVKTEKTDKLDLKFDWEKDGADKLEPGNFYFDTYQVYKCVDDGSLETVVSRPWWYWLFNIGVTGCVAFCGAIGIGILTFIQYRGNYRAVKKSCRGKENTLFNQNRKGRILLNYFRTETYIHLIYAALDVAFGIWFNGILCIGIMPLGIHFIVSSWILWNMPDRLKLSDAETKIIDYWKVGSMGSFIIAFLSAIVAVICSQQ